MTIIIPPRTEAKEYAWCSECGIHLALPPNRPICTMCVDKAARELRGDS